MHMTTASGAGLGGSLQKMQNARWLWPLQGHSLVCARTAPGKPCEAYWSGSVDLPNCTQSTQSTLRTYRTCIDTNPNPYLFTFYAGLPLLPVALSSEGAQDARPHKLRRYL